MDAADAWLREHDPDYVCSRENWKHIDEDGEYRCPPQEIPFGGAADLEMLVEAGEGRYVEPTDYRACERCDVLFVPKVPWQRFCSEACKKQAKWRRAA